MKKESFTEKMIRRSYESAAFQQSWSVHMAAFGPILEPAFREQYEARIHLCAALNHISKRQLSQGLAKLKQMEKYLQTDEDKCAYLFFLGVYSEMTGSVENMVAMYSMANEYGHKFYLPYMKLGKFYLGSHLYEKAEAQYRTAISCFTATGLSEQHKLILGSAYTNLASCLLMTHRLEEAEQALHTSESICPDAPGRAAVEAMLYALRQNRGVLQICLTRLHEHSPETAKAVQESVEKILAGTDPLFFPQSLDEKKIADFWDWFAGYSGTLKDLLEKQTFEKALTPVAEHLLETFPFLEEIPNVALGKNAEGWVIRLQDLYAVAVMDAYEKLLAACPEAVKDDWQFDVAHE